MIQYEPIENKGNLMSRNRVATSCVDFLTITLYIITIEELT